MLRFLSYDATTYAIILSILIGVLVFVGLYL